MAEKTVTITFSEWEAKSLLGYGGPGGNGVSGSWAAENAAALEKIRNATHEAFPIRDAERMPEKQP